MICKGWTGCGIALSVSSYLISAYVIAEFWSGYRSYNSVRVEPDTDYLRWTTRLPAVSVCQAAAFDSSSLDLDTKDDLDFIHNLVRPKRLMCRNCKNISSTLTTADLGQIAFKVVANCPSLLYNCSFNGKQFNCCQRFGQLMTKKGVCYSINSEMARFNFKLSVSHFARDANLIFSVNFPVQVFIHDSREVLFLNRRAPLVDQESSLTLVYRTSETVVDGSVRDVAVQQRGCIMEGERNVSGYPAYSRSSCRSSCLAVAQRSKCGCHHHLLPSDDPVNCDLRGLQCLDHHFGVKSRIKEKSEFYEKCDCLPSCEQQEVKVVWGQLRRNTSSSTSIKIQLIAPPTERYVLKSRIEFLDVLVAFACFTRLFSSISILDIIGTVIKWIYPPKSNPYYRDISFY